MKISQILAIGLACIVTISSLNASCGCANCPIINYSPSTDKRVEIGLSYEYINQDQIYIGNNRSTVGAIPEHHDEKETLNMLYIVNAKYAITPEWRLRAALPYTHRVHEHIHNHHGEQEIEKWDISGFGDIEIVSDHTLYRSGDSELGITAGVKLPTGKTHLKNNKEEEAEVSIQPGSGSTDYCVGLFYQHGLITVPNTDRQYMRLPIILGTTYTISGRGTEQWQFGNKLLANIGTSYLVSKKISTGLDITYKSQKKALSGSTGEPSDNTGGEWVYIAPNIVVALSHVISLKTVAQIPVWQDVNGLQTVSPWNLRVDLGLHF